MDDLDRLGRAAVASLVDEIGSRLDVDDALRRVVDRDQTATLVSNERVLRLPHRRQRVWAFAGAAASVALLVVGGVALGRRDGGGRVVPVDSVPGSQPITSSTTTQPTTDTSPSSTVGPVDTADPAVVTVDASTPVIDGEVVYSSPITAAHPWYAAATPSGRVFVGASDGASAEILEVIDGKAVATGIVTQGELRSALDERLYAIDWPSNELVVWAQDATGVWSVESTSTGIGACGFTVQPDAVQCGSERVLMDPPIDAAALEWTGDSQLTATWPDHVARWAIDLESTDVAVRPCPGDDCVPPFWRVGDGVAWTPVLDHTSRLAARLVSILRADQPPATAWLNCGDDCRVIGSTDGAIYTIGYQLADDGVPSLFVRKYGTDLIASEPVPDLSADAMAGWPQPPSAAPSLADVPMMLPTPAPASDGLPVRREYADSPVDTPEFTQVWFADNTDVAMTITTRPGRPNYPVDGDEVVVAPWDRAVFAQTSGGYQVLGLDDPSGSVTVWAHGLDREEVLAVAAELQRSGGDRGGWDPGYLPESLGFVYEGWGVGAASRSVNWSAGDTAAELWIVNGVPGAFLTPFPATIGIVDISGTGGVAYRVDDQRSAVVWSPQPDLVVLLGLRGSVDQALTIARSVHVVDEPTWLASTTPDTTGQDGCNSMFC